MNDLFREELRISSNIINFKNKIIIFMMDNTVIIKNPLIFFNQKYFEKKVLKDEFAGGIVNIISRNELPTEILITFSTKAIANSFIAKFNGESFEGNLDQYTFYNFLQ